MAAENQLYRQFGEDIRKGNADAYQHYREAVRDLAMSVTTLSGVDAVYAAHKKESGIV